MRLFAASFLRPSNQQAYRRLVEELARQHAGLRGVPDGTIHVTLAFMPVVDEDGLPALMAAVQQVSGAHQAVEIRLGSPRVLSGGSSPRLICADLVSGAALVRRLTAELADRLAGAIPDIEVRPAGAPHVTLARFRKRCTAADGRAVTQLLADRAAGFERSDRVDRVALVASVLTSKGPVYEIKAECPLGC